MGDGKSESLICTHIPGPACRNAMTFINSSRSVIFAAVWVMFSAGNDVTEDSCSHSTYAKTTLLHPLSPRSQPIAYRWPRWIGFSSLIRRPDVSGAVMTMLSIAHSIVAVLEEWEWDQTQPALTVENRYCHNAHG
jgi:hypothetical protein